MATFVERIDMSGLGEQDLAASIKSRCNDRQDPPTNANLASTFTVGQHLVLIFQNDDPT